jgi:hypothetical protein
MVVIIQAAPTACISPPKFDAKLAKQFARNVRLRSGASGAARSGCDRSMESLYDSGRVSPRSCRSALRLQPVRTIRGKAREMPWQQGRAQREERSQPACVCG